MGETQCDIGNSVRCDGCGHGTKRGKLLPRKNNMKNTHWTFEGEIDGDERAQLRKK